MTRKLNYLGLMLAIGLAATTASAIPARADHALVVGVDRYPDLPSEAQLSGSTNDAQAMKGTLTKLGFDVTLLTDEKATRQGILDALSMMETKNLPRERFVFFFAGHGSKSPDGSGCILPSDANTSDKSSALMRDELYQAITAIPADGRTILLDSCFSGAMQRSYELNRAAHPKLKSRYFDFFGRAVPGTPVVEEVNDRSIDSASENSADACYFVATNPYQQAYEDEIDGKEDGLFTHYLVESLSQKPKIWSNVQADVTGGVMDLSEQTQTPTLSPGYEELPIFATASTAGPGPSPVSAPVRTPVTVLAPPAPATDVPTAQPKQTIWEQFNRSHDDPTLLTLTMAPNRTTVAIGQQFTFRAHSWQDGYLVVLELDTEGSLDLLFPTTLIAKDGKVTAGSDVELPNIAGQSYTVDKEGAEAVRAIFLRSETDAQNLLNAFPPDKGLGSWLRVKDRKLVMVSTSSLAPDFTTAELGFEASTAQP